MEVLPLGIAWVAAVLLAPFNGRQKWVGWLAVEALAASFIATIWLAVIVLRDGPQTMVAGGWVAGVGITLRADELGIVFALVSLGALLAALTYEVLGGVHERTLPTLVMFMAAGLSGLFLTGDVFNFYVFFEISMAAAFVLISYGRQDRQIRAALLFMVVNIVGSVIFLSGIAALYHVTGTLDMRQIAALLDTQAAESIILIGVMFLVAFSIKLGLFPFHFWLPPVYRDSWPAVAAILSGALANIGSYGLIRFGADLMVVELQLGATALLILGAVSIVYGANQAVSVRTASEALAYSTIGQAGYILIALGVGGPIGYSAAVLYALINPLNKVVLFLATGLRGWLVGACFFIGALSVAGVPPAVGFFGKLALFQAGVAADSISLIVLIFAGGALSFVYMFQIYQRGFWAIDRSILPSPLSSRLLLLSLAGIILFFGIWPEPLLALSQRAADILVLRLEQLP